MKRVVVFFLFVLFFKALPLFSEHISPPKLWLKPYRLGELATFVDIDSVISNSSFSFGYINFNIGLTSHVGTPFFCYTDSDMSINGKITVLSVYFTVSKDTIGIWDISGRGVDGLWLNSVEVGYRDFTIPYRSFTEQGPIVNISRLNYFESSSSAGYTDTLKVGSSGRYSFDGMFGEFIYFDRDISTLEEHQWATYLAIKYGITLCGNYIDLRGDTIWDIDKNKRYSSGIAGVWRNDFFGLFQPKSGIYLDDVVIELTDTIADGAYLLWGEDGGFLFPNIPLTIDTIEYLLFDRKWKVLPSEGFLGTSTSLSYRYPSGISPLGIVLVVDRYGFNGEFNSSGISHYSPTRVVDDMVFFDNIFWDTDGNGSDYFSIAVVADSINKPVMAMPIGESLIEQEANIVSSTDYFSRSDDILSNGLNNHLTGVFVELTPNPTDGEFRLVIRQGQPSALIISIVDSTGKLVKKYNKPNAGLFTELEDTIDTTGIFLIHIDSEKERRTLKLVVK